MLRTSITLSVATIVLAGVGRIGLAANLSIYSLGEGRGYSINASGQVAVTTFHLFGDGTASRYDGIPGTGGALSSLGTLPGDQSAFATAINSTGQVAGHSQLNTVSSPTRAFRDDGTPGAGGIMRDLGTLGGFNSQALGINDLGQVTGFAETDPNGTTPGSYAFVYDGTPGAGGVMRTLGSLGGTSSSGAAINNAGQVAGTSEISPGGVNHAFRYDGPAGSGIMRDLGTAPGFTTIFGNAINASGQVVGEMDNAAGTIGHAFLYTGTPGLNGVMTDLKTLAGGTVSAAVGITDAGYVLGMSDKTGSDLVPVLWRPDGSMIELNALLDATNPGLGQYWTLMGVYGISNNGLITGDAFYTPPGSTNGSVVAFVLDASSLVPEPSSIVLATLGFACFAAWGWRLRKRSRA